MNLKALTSSWRRSQANQVCGHLRHTVNPCIRMTTEGILSNLDPRKLGLETGVSSGESQRWALSSQTFCPDFPCSAHKREFLAQATRTRQMLTFKLENYNFFSAWMKSQRCFGSLKYTPPNKSPILRILKSEKIKDNGRQEAICREINKKGKSIHYPLLETKC